MKYTSQQNTYHFLRALQAVNEPGIITRPFDCPEYRWKQFLSEARKSLPSMASAIDRLARTPMRQDKHIVSRCT